MSMSLPHELQSIIFKTAAIDDLQCALSLVRVAKYVRDMIHPIIYDNIVLKTTHAATCLLRTVQSYPTRPIKPKSIVVSQDIPLSTLSSLFSTLTGSVVKLSIYRNSDNRGAGLQFVQSTSISHLTVIGQECPGAIPAHLIPSITHLAMVSLNDRQVLSEAIKLADILHRNTSILGSILGGAVSFVPPFRNLTHFACFLSFFLDHHSMSSPMKLHMTALKCCAILCDPEDLDEGVLLARAWEDPRVVIIKNSDFGVPLEWYSSDNVGLSNFWAMAERLVADHYLCDDGIKWDESVITKFRQQNPEIGLLGY